MSEENHSTNPNTSFSLLMSNPNPSSNSHNQKQASCFLRALSFINQTTPKPPPSRLHRSIKRAAYASMAYSAGPRRAWSRALLHRLRNRSLNYGLVFRRGVIIRRRPLRVATRMRPDEPRRSDDLRRLVPGGEVMDFCSLLEETTSYVQRLTAQVDLMNKIVDIASHH